MALKIRSKPSTSGRAVASEPNYTVRPGCKLCGSCFNDSNALFRDKAACALAYDQIHLTDEQKVQLYEGLISGLSSKIIGKWLENQNGKL